MTVFVFASAAMVAAALVWLAWPLIRKGSAELAAHRREIRASVVILCIALPTLAAVMYARLSDWNFDEAARQAAAAAETDRLVRRVEQHLKENPQDMDGWMRLGAMYMQLERFPRAVEAFQHAYDISKGEDVEATVALAEALAFTDNRALAGRAGQLLDAAIAKAPNHPRALFYGSLAAMQAGDLATARDRLQMLLALNPPENLRAILERQIQDLDEQLGRAGEGESTARPAATGRSVRVSVSIAPELKAQLPQAAPLFILARDPAGGPPLAVQRHSASAAPLTIELTERDAMTPSRTIAGVDRVQIIARISQSGAPQAQSGDFYGQIDHTFSADGGDAVNIVIDKVVP